MTLSPRRAADFLAERLYEAGCRYAFGMPGGEVLTLVDALRKVGIEFILVKHENSAGFMAEGAYHRTGAPGILVATLGPGAMNGINSIVNAYQDRVPLIVLTGCVDEDEALTYTHQIMDHSAVFNSITKATFRLTADGADTVTDKAVAIATEGRPGPVHIDVPISVADTQSKPNHLRRRSPASPLVPAQGQDFIEACNWINAATKPVMIIGLDAMNDMSGAQILSFCEAYNVPFMTTYKAKGIVPEGHPLCLRSGGLSPLADKHLVPFIQSSDLVICVGYDPIEMRPGWRDIWDPAQTNVIDITAEPNHHYMHQATLNFIADTGATLALLSENTKPTTTWQNGEIKAIKASLDKAFPHDDTWGPAAVIAECRANLPKNTLATADSGAHRILLSQMWDCYEPRGLMQSSALCTMGCAVPLAMGAKIASPDRPIVSFSGDAGFLMVAGELATAAELEIKPIFVVFVDASLALIELKQRQRQLTNHAVDFGTHDYAAIARSFGGAGHTVGSREELQEALAQAQTADTFTLIAATIDRGDYDDRI
ncbi:thiamine pyrophosphate-binding protein [Amylibacter sp. SFDW26]|uniref:thiamine pyrophosphate-binding protein n=1 Tax=Amylibacter sp. SFDW26 TaxID=2652722 RepID=UPI001261FF81|nr:thiamine pyrophosphate-binding protein [Amylibacter sp. SFDW26]KAB7616148.1 thiamine pyrophosphate-binding protein [Amylibacter sp. SFDW26]